MTKQVPPHVFALLQAHTDHEHTYPDPDPNPLTPTPTLQAHTDHEHADRHFGTHAMHVRRGARRHLLVNAHPVYGEAAYAMGCINEPSPRRPPTFETRQLRIRPADARQQRGGGGGGEEALAHWRAFVADFPQILETSCFFVSLRSGYDEAAELTATYARGYLRTYDAWGLPGTPPTVRIAPDTFGAELRRRCEWPRHVAAWWNPSMQPRFRRAFAFRPTSDASGWAVGAAVQLLRDSRRVVACRRLLSKWGIGTHQKPRPPPKRVTVRLRGRAGFTATTPPAPPIDPASFDEWRAYDA